MVNLYSNVPGEINRFLSSFFNKNLKLSANVMQWAYSYKNPLDSINIICTLMDNIDKYKIDLFIQFGRNDTYTVTKHNYNNVVKDIIGMFYN